MTPGPDGSFFGSFSGIVPSVSFISQSYPPETARSLFRLKPGSDTPTIIDINPGEATSFVDNLTVFKGRSISPPRQRRTARNSTGSAPAARRPNSSTSTWARPVRPPGTDGTRAGSTSRRRPRPTVVSSTGSRPGAIVPPSGHQQRRRGLEPVRADRIQGQTLLHGGDRGDRVELFRLASHWSRPVAIDINEGPEDSDAERLLRALITAGAAAPSHRHRPVTAGSS